MRLKNFIYLIGFLVFSDTSCFRDVLQSADFLHRDLQNTIADPLEDVIFQISRDTRADSPEPDFAAIRREEEEQRIREHAERVQAFYEQQARVPPEQLLANIKNARMQLRGLRKLNAQSFAVHFFSKYNDWAESLFFHSQLHCYQDIVRLLLQKCLLPDNPTQQAIATRLNEFLFGQDPGRGSFDNDVDVAIFSRIVRERLKTDQQLCNRIDEMLTARGVNPRECVWSQDSPQQIAYNNYLTALSARKSTGIRFGCIIS